MSVCHELLENLLLFVFRFFAHQLTWLTWVTSNWSSWQLPCPCKAQQMSANCNLTILWLDTMTSSGTLSSFQFWVIDDLTSLDGILTASDGSWWLLVRPFSANYDNLQYCTYSTLTVQYTMVVKLQASQKRNRPRTNSKEGAPWAIHLLLVINFKALKCKTNTNHNPDPNRYRRCCPDPNARIQKFMHYMAIATFAIADLAIAAPVSYTHLTLPTIYSV